ncbi:MAG: NAD(P)/FAD-dependent oxidoreductase [Oscillospiraceae bacterium]|nr:NAD(P)/FAD-dependent oxidoreductase [Oscillospiraceae bacterium]
MYDVLIAGAGPAGCAAAAYLAGRGLRVLLAERQRLPRYKSCSGILIQKSLDLIAQDLGQTVPDRVTCAPADNRGMVFTDDQGREYRFEQGGRNVWRDRFDGWLAELARARGAEVTDGALATGCEDLGDAVAVHFPGRTERARYLLDCTGVTGVLRRKLTGRRGGYITTFQTFHRGVIDLDPHYFYAYLQPELSQYDAWFNVKDGLLVLGVSARETGRIAEFHPKFLAYLASRHGLRIGKALRAERWLMPRVEPGCPVCPGQGRVLLAGEAAGFLNPMGEGISAALESGRLAAEAVAAHLHDPPAALRAYAEAAAPLQSYMQRQWRLVGQLSGTFREMAAAAPQI